MILFWAVRVVTPVAARFRISYIPNMAETPFTGLVEMIGDKKFGFIREFRPDVPKGDNDPFVPPAVVKKYRLRSGCLVEGTLRKGRKGSMQVARIDSVMNMPTFVWEKLKPFDSGKTIYPNEKFNIVAGPGDISMRVVDLVAPMGKGQRALIVAPPRCGKTVLIKQMARALEKNEPETEVVALLVDERPEEVTDFIRTTAATVFASSNDRDTDNHVRVSTMALEYARRLVEMRRDVVIFLDSLTRLGRTFNQHANSGRTLSGGLDAKALVIPRRIFGSARNIEGGGSLTIIGTALIETGSRMDEVIFEEFKGTGNSEIVLDRRMADKRIYPAINIRKSRTRNEELLLGDYAAQHQELFRALNTRIPPEAMQALLRHVMSTRTNEELLDKLIPSDVA
ncbi:MAG: transcription termination factor Rho [Bacteroidota bacterium]